MDIKSLIFGNMEAIEESALCYCLECKQLFPGQDVEEYAHKPGVGLSGKCPVCGKVSLIPSASGFDFNDPEQLKGADEAWKLSQTP